MTPTFLNTSFVICATPGTGALFTLGAGLAALLHASEVAFAVIKYLGVACLVYLAWATGGTRAHGRSTAGRSLVRLVR